MKQPYVLAVAHFIAGTLIILINGLLCASVLTSRKLQTTANILLCNMWLVNLILGVVTAVHNIMEEEEQRITVTAVSTSEWSVVVVNCFVTVSMLLTLTTSRLVTIRSQSNRHHMSLKSVFKLMAVLWATVFVLSSTKAIVASLHKRAPDAVCYDCFLGFEITSLFIFTLVTLVMYCASLYLITVRKNRTVYDLGAAVAQPTSVELYDLSNEYKLTSTVGLMLMNFVLACAAYVIFETLLIAAHSARFEINPVEHRFRYSNDLIVGVLYAHCLINPIVFICRDEATGDTVRCILLCARRGGRTGADDCEENTAFLRPNRRTATVGPVADV